MTDTQRLRESLLGLHGSDPHFQDREAGEGCEDCLILLEPFTDLTTRPDDAYAQRDDNWRRLCEANTRLEQAEGQVEFLKDAVRQKDEHERSASALSRQNAEARRTLRRIADMPDGLVDVARNLADAALSTAEPTNIGPHTTEEFLALLDPTEPTKGEPTRDADLDGDDEFEREPVTAESTGEHGEQSKYCRCGRRRERCTAEPTKEEPLKVEVHYKDAARPLVYEAVANTYVKGPFYCVYLAGGIVKKHPVANIWRITEDY